MEYMSGRGKEVFQIREWTGGKMGPYDRGKFRGTRDVRQAAEIVVQLATLPEDGQTGGFFNDQGIIPW
ncbi:hypothetical protein [Paenibacillus uliginis]|uniref:hypothetical protein n=1 Tax=Paenibacillus uliginis TaxID=683737 RepID=UPI001AD7FD36|nr:hypothetical protein [Paenibacillus uliginis]